MIDFHTHAVLIRQFAEKYPEYTRMAREVFQSGIQCSFPIENGKVVRGSRQTIQFMEYDGPVERTYLVQVLGE